jgi:2-polyprenyl-6-methoxyphenol hydroxylase-like FAD-dependent oxidoreductase
MPHEWSLADVRMQSPWPIEPANILLRKEGMLFALRIKEDLFRLRSNRPHVLQNLPDGIIVRERLWETQFEVGHRQVSSYQSGFVFLVGDAAHVHAPMGARGMNMSIEDSETLIERLITDNVDAYSNGRLRAGASALRMIKA